MDLKPVLEILIQKQTNLRVKQGLRELLYDIDDLTPERIAEKIHNMYFEAVVESWEEGIAYYKK